MSYNTDLQNNNTSLQEILATVNSLPEAGGSSGGGLEWIDVLSLPVNSTGTNSYALPYNEYIINCDFNTVAGIWLTIKTNTNTTYQAFKSSYFGTSAKDDVSLIALDYATNSFSIKLATENDLEYRWIVEAKALLIPNVLN